MFSLFTRPMLVLPSRDIKKHCPVANYSQKIGGNLEKKQEERTQKPFKDDAVHFFYLCNKYNL